MKASLVQDDPRYENLTARRLKNVVIGIHFDHCTHSLTYDQGEDGLISGQICL